jgi:hypothetical protein
MVSMPVKPSRRFNLIQEGVLEVVDKLESLFANPPKPEHRGEGDKACRCGEKLRSYSGGECENCHVERLAGANVNRSRRQTEKWDRRENL